MSTHLFEELLPWYQPRVSEMVLVAFRLSEALRDRMKQSPTYQREGEGQFIREAIGEKLRSMGFEIPDEEIYRGPRTGIGGRPTHRSNRQSVADLSGGLGDVKRVEAASLAEDSATPYKVAQPTDSLSTKVGKAALKTGSGPKGKAKR